MLTSQKTYELRIEMEDYQNGTFYASYK
ncbi:UNVERIFIED_CONTAM: hypothetical protein GTU68_016726 [Idotea baltica]|nr:hypothetical protein [Idotea baltica]MCL4149800.1 hypothetical protein [Idotea baltica]